MSLAPPEPNPGITYRFVAMAVQSVAVAANPNFDGNFGSAGFKANVATRVMRPAEALNRQIHLHVDVQSLDNPANTPYTGHIVIVGNIEFTADGDREELDRHAAWGVIGAMIGGARSYFDMISAVGPYGRLMLNLMSPALVLQNAIVFDSRTSRLSPLYPDEIDQAGKDLILSANAAAESNALNN